MQQGGLIKMPKVSPEEFFSTLAPVAVPICKAYGLPPSVLLAQAAIESGWNQYTIGQFNLFGRKWNDCGPYLERWTEEQQPEDAYALDEQHIYLGSGWWQIWAKFQDYSTIEEAVTDWCVLITQDEKYQEVNNHVTNLRDFIRTLAAIYATRETYADDIMTTVRANDLTQYDA